LLPIESGDEAALTPVADEIFLKLAADLDGKLLGKGENRRPIKHLLQSSLLPLTTPSIIKR
jgi:hypothetical protein